MKQIMNVHVKMDNELILNVRFSIKKYKNLFRINLLL